MEWEEDLDGLCTPLKEICSLWQPLHTKAVQHAYVCPSDSIPTKLVGDRPDIEIFYTMMFIYMTDNLYIIYIHTCFHHWAHL